jgi:hypothetical protein
VNTVTEMGAITGLLTLLITMILIPILAHLFKRNELMHDTNQAVLAKHSEALAILVEKSDTDRRVTTETSRTVNDLSTQVVRLTTAIEGYRNNG